MATTPGDEIQRLVVSIVGNHLPYLGALAIAQAATVRFASHVDFYISKRAAAPVYLFGTAMVATAGATVFAWQQMAGAIEETVRKASDTKQLVSTVTTLKHAAEVAGLSMDVMKMRMSLGRASFAAAYKDAKKLGLLFSQSEGMKVKRAGEEVRRVGQAIKGLSTQILIAAAPALIRFARSLSNLISKLTWFAAQYKRLTLIMVTTLGVLTATAAATAGLVAMLIVEEYFVWACVGAWKALKIAILGANIAMRAFSRNPLVSFLMLLLSIPLLLGGYALLDSLTNPTSSPDNPGAPSSAPNSSDRFSITSTTPMGRGGGDTQLASLFRQNLGVSQQIRDALKGQPAEPTTVHIV